MEQPRGHLVICVVIWNTQQRRLVYCWTTSRIMNTQSLMLTQFQLTRWNAIICFFLTYFNGWVRATL
jgi:hypothetical protein